ncbi:MAG: MBL fold metallo-hydrolase [Thaumarchaeota archaeon]|nr:MBL fold metallo-hydrolase [Nitrososphaerota archaeon]
MPVKQVAENVFVNLGKSDSIHDGWGANQTFIVTHDGVILIDTGFTNKISYSLLKEIKKRTYKPVKLVINTHDHSDHVFGNSVFEATILAHENCKTRIIGRGEERIKAYRRLGRKLKEDLDGISIAPPQRTYKEGFVEYFGEKTLKIIHPKKGAHTDGDTMVLLPDDKVLISGDVLSVNYHPNIEDANLPAWLNRLEEIKGMRIDQIVPGHGTISSKEHVGTFASYLRKFDTEVRKRVKEGTKDIPILEGSEDWKLKMIVERNFRLLYNKYSGAEQFYDAIPR